MHHLGGGLGDAIEYRAQICRGVDAAADAPNGLQLAFGAAQTANDGVHAVADGSGDAASGRHGGLGWHTQDCKTGIR